MATDQPEDLGIPQRRVADLSVIQYQVGALQTALDRGIGGPLLGPSAYFMKSPPTQFHDEQARDMVEDFSRGPS